MFRIFNHNLSDIGICAIWKIRGLNYDKHTHRAAHLLDRILLFAALIGELIFCVASLVALLSQKIDERHVSLVILLTLLQVNIDIYQIEKYLLNVFSSVDYFK
jgi:hypothetical protein